MAYAFTQCHPAQGRTMNEIGAASSLLEKTANSGVKVPAHQHVYARLRESLLFGDYAPGMALTIQGLVTRTGAGMTPVREALRRLTSEGAVEMLGNRRLVVPRLTRDRAEEILFLRSSLEPELTRRATPALEPFEIGALEETDRALNAAIMRGDIPGYLLQNYRFHMDLFDAAGAPVMAEIVDRLWLRFGPSMRVVCGRFGTLNLPDRHAEILSALHARDGDAAAHAMREDVAQGMALILDFSDSIDAG
jgi:DNA-binding GntR family transcriptional regulator